MSYKKENYLDLIIEIGVASLSANFQKMTINQFFCINPEKDLETFFRINNINPKRKFEDIVKNVGKKVLQDGFSNNIIQEIRKNNDEDIKFIVQDFNNVFRNLNGLSILDFQKKNFDLILYIIVKSNLKKREEISLKGIYQIPILSRMDVKYKELNKSEGKKC
ncbi:hypothetical protein [Streptococcus uberis]|uniref:hypothetical protein n=1 Tax=Streptococcus uberis TaxID=1349 RepID=UPI001939BF00|nr:hypothetical protein [Streptococcus uberis]